MSRLARAAAGTALAVATLFAPMVIGPFGVPAVPDPAAASTPAHPAARHSVTARRAVAATTPCRGNRLAQLTVVSIGRQRAWMCERDRQVHTDPVTTGATAAGNGTPTGSWRIQARQRDRYLYPAGGGAFWVRYWVPYDGDFGFHDASWQHIGYGSAAYRTGGSHGCVHLPAADMAWFYDWSRVGATVRVTG